MTQGLDPQYHSRLEKAKLMDMTFESSHRMIFVLPILDLNDKDKYYDRKDNFQLFIV